MGLLAVLRDVDYIYQCAEGGLSGLVLTCLFTTEDVFGASKYESLLMGTTPWTIGVTTANRNGQFKCSVYGSVFSSNYFHKSVIIRDILMTSTNMYTSDTPYGPCSEEYTY